MTSELGMIGPGGGTAPAARGDLFDYARLRLDWLDQRQVLHAQNVANANTPGYIGRDLKPFAEALADAGMVGPMRTDPRHLRGTRDGLMLADRRHRPHQKGIDGNAVDTETELKNVADTETAHETVTAIYKKYLGLFRLALGR